jgi:four helix bundle protein
MNIAESSLEECRYYLILTKDLGYCDPTEVHRLLEDIGRLLQAYIRGLLNPRSTP